MSGSDSDIRDEKNKDEGRNVRYADDLYRVKLLIEGDSNAWSIYYKEYRDKAQKYIEQKYSDILNASDIEKICDDVYERLTKNDFKALRDYRGECSFPRYLRQATDWAIKDHFTSNPQILLEDSLETIPNIEEQTGARPACDDESEYDVPPQIKSLSDDLRQAFLLRYYDYFEFPPEDIRLLSKKKGLPIKEITKMLTELLGPRQDDLLTSRRQQQQTQGDKLTKLFSELSEMRLQMEKVQKRLEEIISGTEEHNKITKQLSELKHKIKLKEKMREKTLKMGRVVITTPYKIIAEILDENESTIRSRVFQARSILMDVLLKDGLIKSDKVQHL